MGYARCVWAMGISVARVVNFERRERKIVNMGYARCVWAMGSRRKTAVISPGNAHLPTYHPSLQPLVHLLVLLLHLLVHHHIHQQLEEEKLNLNQKKTKDFQKEV